MIDQSSPPPPHLPRPGSCHPLSSLYCVLLHFSVPFSATHLSVSNKMLSSCSLFSIPILSSKLHPTFLGCLCLSLAISWTQGPLLIPKSPGA